MFSCSTESHWKTFLLPFFGMSRWNISSFSLLWGGAARKGFVLLLCRRYPPDLKRDSQVSLHMVRWTKGGK